MQEDSFQEILTQKPGRGCFKNSQTQLRVNCIFLVCALFAVILIEFLETNIVELLLPFSSWHFSCYNSNHLSYKIKQIFERTPWGCFLLNFLAAEVSTRNLKLC